VKKSVVLIIIAVYILSVCVVGFFGIKAKMYNETVNVESVTIQNEVSITIGDKEEIKEITLDEETGEKSIIVKSKRNTTLTFKIYYLVNPADATDKRIQLNFTKHEGISVSQAPGEDAVIVTIELAKVTKMQTITIQSLIDPNLCDTITIGAQVLNLG